MGLLTKAGGAGGVTRDHPQPSASRRSVRQLGQRVLDLQCSSRHSAWNTCPQCSFRHGAPASNSLRHTEHVSSAPAAEGSCACRTVSTSSTCGGSCSTTDPTDSVSACKSSYDISSVYGARARRHCTHLQRLSVQNAQTHVAAAGAAGAVGCAQLAVAWAVAFCLFLDRVERPRVPTGGGLASAEAGAAGAGAADCAGLEGAAAGAASRVGALLLVPLRCPRCCFHSADFGLLSLFFFIFHCFSLGLSGASNDRLNLDLAMAKH